MKTTETYLSTLNEKQQLFHLCRTFHTRKAFLKELLCSFRLSLCLCISQYFTACFIPEAQLDILGVILYGENKKEQKHQKNEKSSVVLLLSSRCVLCDWPPGGEPTPGTLYSPNCSAPFWFHLCSLLYSASQETTPPHM